MAQGFGGQYIIVIPDQDLVVVYTSALAGEAMNTPQTLMREYVLGAVSSETPLPPDPGGKARLATAVARARSGPVPDPPELPETAANVDGVRYDFRANDVGNTSFVIRFEDNSAILSSEDDIARVTSWESVGGTTETIVADRTF